MADIDPRPVSPDNIEQQARDIVAEVQAHAAAGTLTKPMLSVAIAAMQDFLDYLERLETSVLFISDAGTMGDVAAEAIPNLGVWKYGN